MFRLVFGGKRDTFKPVKDHVAGSKREAYSNLSLKTLGSGDLQGAVRLPVGEDLNEWVAANTVDFFNEVSLIWGIVCDVGVVREAVGSGFPSGFEYRWSDGSRFKTPISCSGPEYVEFVMNWIEKEINNESLFPTSSSSPFPRSFIQSVKVIYTRLFRIFAIIYTHHFTKLEQIGAVSHLNTSFKHFVFFVWEFDLVAPAELEALSEIVQELQNKYGAFFEKKK